MKKRNLLAMALALLWPSLAYSQDWSGDVSDSNKLQPGGLAAYEFTDTTDSNVLDATRCLSIVYGFDPDVVGANVDGAANLLSCPDKDSVASACVSVAALSGDMTGTVVSITPGFLIIDPTADPTGTARATIHCSQTASSGGGGVSGGGGGVVGSYAAFNDPGGNFTIPAVADVVNGVAPGTLVEREDSDGIWSTVANVTTAKFDRADGNRWNGLVTMTVSGENNTGADKTADFRIGISTTAGCAPGTYTVLNGTRSEVTTEDGDWFSITLSAFIGPVFGSLVTGNCVGLVAVDEDGVGFTMSTIRFWMVLLEVRPATYPRDSFTTSPTNLTTRTTLGPGGVYTSGELMKGGLLDNCGAAGSVEVDFPACVTGDNFTALVCAAQDFILDPDAAESFNPIDADAGDAITGDAVGDIVSCHCINSGDWICTGAGFAGTP